MKKFLSAAAKKMIPLAIMLAGMLAMALDGTGDPSFRTSDIQEMNDITSVGWTFVGYIQAAIVVMVILIFAVNVAMEAGKERPDLAGILQKLLWAGGIGGMAFMVVQLIVTIYGAGISHAMIAP